MLIRLDQFRTSLKKLGSPAKAKISARFFKTGDGQYGAGDVFLGLTVPEQRTIAGKYTDLKYQDLQALFQSAIHEERLVALLILVDRFKKTDGKGRSEVVKFYLKNTRRVNNWDLVDLSADKILGEYLVDKDRKILYKLAKSDNLWERRIAIISTYAFIRKGDFEDTLKIVEILLNDRHDLIQKAVGWMLREVGKRDVNILFSFLDKHYKEMSRTTLRYAIERFAPDKKSFYMKK